MKKISSSDFKNIFLKEYKLISSTNIDPIYQKLIINNPFEIIEPFSFDSSTGNFQCQVIFENLKFTKFDISQTRFKITLKNCIVNELFISDPTLRDDLSVEIIEGAFDRIQIRSNYQVSIINAKIENLVIDDNKKFIFLNNNKDNEKMLVSNLIIRKNHTKIILNNLRINSYQITENNFSEITCSNSIIEKLEFHNFTNINNTTSRGKIIFDNIFFRKLIYIKKSKLGIIEFKNLSFREVHWYILDSDFEEFKTHNVSWHYKLNLINADKNISSNFLEFFNKLSKSKGDTNSFDSLHFNALKLEAYRRSQKLNWSNFGDLFILWLSKHTNYYRMQWIRTGIIYIVLGFLLFIGINLIEGISFSTEWGKLFVFYNPAHHIDFLSEDGFKHNSSYFIDFLSRILFAFLIYQFIQAFRKFLSK